jgi:hypothetical protein
MAKFPVDGKDPEGIEDAVNYLLSGPAGLGQNFAGYSAFEPAWLTSNFRTPYTSNTVDNMYVPPITLSKSEMLSGDTWKYTFDTAQTTPPFSPGNNIKIDNVDDAWYDGTIDTIGVIDCTTEYVIGRTTSSYAIHGPSTGGYVWSSPLTDVSISTDCNSFVTIDSVTDRVFISSQINSDISYTIPGTFPKDNLTVRMEMNRYVGGLEGGEYRFGFDKTVARKDYRYTDLSGEGTLPLLETIFTTILDRPAPGYYWYILEYTFYWDQKRDPNLSEYEFEDTSQVTSVKIYLRSISTQVVKE